MKKSQPLSVGIGGPVGSGKTALTLALCRALRERYDLAVVTNDIYTEEDAQFLVRHQALPAERILGVETGGCPHTAIREDASINLEAVDRLCRRFPNLDLIFIESGGDNLAASFSPELADVTIYVIDVAAGDKIPRKGGPGITKSDLLIINKIDLAPLVGASLEVMDRDAKKMRGDKPFVFTNLKTGEGVADVIAFLEKQGLATVLKGTFQLATKLWQGRMTYARSDEWSHHRAHDSITVCANPSFPRMRESRIYSGTEWGEPGFPLIRE